MNLLPDRYVTGEMLLDYAVFPAGLGRGARRKRGFCARPFVSPLATRSRAST